MKKKCTMILAIVGSVVTCISIVISLLNRHRTTNLTVIGGSDGPTAIFLAGSFGFEKWMIGTVIGVLLVLIALIRYIRYKRMK